MKPGATRIPNTVGARWAATLWAGASILVLLLVLPSGAGAVKVWSDWGTGREYSVDVSLKWTSILSRAPRDTLLYPERWSAATLWRARLTCRAQPVHWLAAEVAYEHRARLTSEGAGEAGGTGILLTDTSAPYRVCQGDKVLVGVGGTFSHRHELDRAVLTLRPRKAEVRIGRQALGFGRGVFFSAVDVFVPFTPLESDREWRRGVDAVRCSVPVTELISVDAVAALGESRDDSAYLVRAHGNVGNTDVEVIAGRRCEDNLLGGSFSTPVYDAEAHCELAFFNTPERVRGGGTFGKRDLVTKLLVGGSYSWDWRGGLMLAGEYHFSGFGLTDISGAGMESLTLEFLARYVRGDTQILGRHACAARLTYGISTFAPVSITCLLSPTDASGVTTTTVSVAFSDNLTLAGSLYVPFGEKPQDGRIRSEYGGVASSGLAQISFYY